MSTNIHCGFLPLPSFGVHLKTENDNLHKLVKYDLAYSVLFIEMDCISKFCKIFDYSTLQESKNKKNEKNISPVVKNIAQ